MSGNSSRSVRAPSPHCQHRTKKRSSLACHQCRVRKVKCDLVERGSPCHNCQLDQVECTASLSRRSRRYRLQRAQLTQTQASRPLVLPRTHLSRLTPSDSNTTDRACEAAQNSTTQFSHAPASPDAQVVHGHDFDIRSNFARSPRPSTRSRIPAILATSPTTHAEIDSFDLPPYIRRPQRILRSEELEYLKSRGALSVPDTPLRDQLFLSFVLYVHPFLPVLNLQDFLSAIEGQSGSGVSLILFQAVMFAGTAFVDGQALLDAGFEDRAAARAYFFGKIKASSYLYFASKSNGLLISSVALRLRLGSRSTCADPSHSASCLVVRLDQRPEGPLVLAGHLHITSHWDRPEPSRYIYHSRR